jgi:DNA-binding NarL/FixJ family response regulator
LVGEHRSHHKPDAVHAAGGPYTPSPARRAPLDILRLISDGFSSREIAGRVHLSENTAEAFDIHEMI